MDTGVVSDDWAKFDAISSSSSSKATPPAAGAHTEEEAGWAHFSNLEDMESSSR